MQARFLATFSAVQATLQNNNLSGDILPQLCINKEANNFILRVNRICPYEKQVTCDCCDEDPCPTPWPTPAPTASCPLSSSPNPTPLTPEPSCSIFFCNHFCYGFSFNRRGTTLSTRRRLEGGNRASLRKKHSIQYNKQSSSRI